MTSDAGVELRQAAVDAAPNAQERLLAAAYMGDVLLDAGRYVSLDDPGQPARQRR